MIEAFVSGGYIMWPVTLAAVLMIGLNVRSALRLSGPARDPADAMADADAALFWGAFASLLGLLGTFVGIMQAAGAISRAGEVSDTLVWAGIRVTLISTVYGLLILATGLLLWGALRLAGRRATEAVA